MKSELPDGWRVAEIGEFEPFITSGSRGWAKYYSRQGDPFVRITNLQRKAVSLDLSDLKYVELPGGESEGTRTAVTFGDLLISITADIGVVNLVDKKLPTPAYINQHLALVRIHSEGLDNTFLAYALSTPQGVASFRQLTDAGAKAGMSLDKLRQVSFALPPRPEQERIVEVLSDLDVLIVSVDTLIAKKEAIKLGIIQDLLTGKRRLPGYKSEWRELSLSDACEMKSGFGITSRSISETGRFRCYGANGIRGYTDRATHSGVFPLIGRVGAQCGNVVLANGDFFASEHAIVVTARDGFDPAWLSLVLARMDLNRKSEASAQPVLTVSKLQLLSLRGPSEESEQNAIAKAIFDADEEIDGLNSRRDKFRSIREGIAQQLLTGRIRLI